MGEPGHGELRQRLFHLIGLEAEALTAVAIEGQASGDDAAKQRDLAGSVHDLGEKLQIIADTVVALC